METKTEFQNICITKCCELLAKYFIESKTIFVQGKKESYYIINLLKFPQKFDIYIYYDEAGIMINDKDWSICEKPDYDDENSLINDFLVVLDSKIKKWC